MRVVRPAFLPDASLARAEMEDLQRDLAVDAIFADDLGFDPVAVSLDATPDEGQATLGDEPPDAPVDPPVVAGVDQAFTDDRAVSAAVALRGGEVVARSGGSAPLELPYIPGLLSFREANAIVDALDGLAVDPDLLVIDGSGRIHFRQAGIATHVGVLYDAPAIGVAKNLLCGTPRDPLDDPLPEGVRVPIDADDGVEPVNEGGDWPVIGHAVQSRQYPDPERRHVNPLYVSPGHRIGAETTADLVLALSGGYKLPEPTRLADRMADELKGG